MRVLLNVTRRVPRGGTVEVKLLISHPMENGQRRNDAGQPIPRQIVHSFRATLAGQEVLSLSLHPAIAANPYLAFAARAERSGPLELTWQDDAGTTQTETVEIEVT